MTDTSIAKERAERESAIERIFSQRDRSVVQDGIEAYKRDRAALLNAGKEYHLVAYEGWKQLAIAPSYDKLQRRLKKMRVTDQTNLFIVDITPDEDSHSR